MNKIDDKSTTTKMKHNKQPYDTKSTLLLLFLVLLHKIPLCSGEDADICESSQGNTNDAKSCSSSSSLSSEHETHYYDEWKDPCRLYFSESTQSSSSVFDFGLFSGIDYPRGISIGQPDIVIQLTDFPFASDVIHHSSSPLFQEGYTTGGHFEAHQVKSLMPGLGMISSSSAAASSFDGTEQHNLLAYRPDVNEADLPRTYSPNAGAFSFYYNMTYFSSQNIGAGTELFVKFPHTRQTQTKNNNNKSSGGSTTTQTQTILSQQITNSNESKKRKKSISDLQQNGICVDTLMEKRSKNKLLGRGAFSTRFIPKGQVITISPLLPFFNNEENDFLMNIRKLVKVKQGKKKKSIRVTSDKEQQLIVNYCFSHPNSTLLLFPYGPIVNFINHADDNDDDEDGEKPNAIIRWSTKFLSKNDNEREETGSRHEQQEEPSSIFQMNLTQIQSLLSNNSNSSSISLDIEDLNTANNFHRNLLKKSLVIEYVATRDIQPNEEIFINYGKDWSKSWKNHFDNIWEPPQNAQYYTPSYIMEDVVNKIRTSAEQVDHPYPENLSFSCFYKYSSNEEDEDSNDVGATSSSGGTYTVSWKPKRGIFNYQYLRPCTIMSRQDDIPVKGGRSSGGEKQSLYMVMIHNHPSPHFYSSFSEKEKIPKGIKHVVTNVPRHAIRFTDKYYSTDQHLENAFRHFIGMPEEMFPEAWMDK